MLSEGMKFDPNATVFMISMMAAVESMKRSHSGNWFSRRMGDLP
jgi:hypothetical protein